MVALLGLGFNGILWIGVIAGLIGIVYGLVDLFSFATEEEEEDELIEIPDVPLYFRIEQEDDMWYFSVFAQNNEFICTSDGFTTHDGAITGLWYLMDSMQKMDSSKWKESSS